MNKVIQQDIELFVKTFELTKELSGKTFIVTGATGLIGSTLIRCLLALNVNINIICPVRNITKAEKLFGHLEVQKQKNLIFVEYGVYDNISIVDYIIHCAAPTSSRFFVEHPVETFNAILDGTSALLKYATSHSVKGFVYLSSLEVYGEICNDSNNICEETQGYINPMSVRSSYPMAKRAAETLCCLYANKYDIPVMVARLTQTTGAGVSKEDNRVITQFARLASIGKDIVLHTTGESARPYCYTIDCVSALLYVLLRGVKGTAYNIANPQTYISVKDMAQYVRENFNPNIEVVFDLKDDMGYSPFTKQRLSTDRLEELGWKPQFGLKDIFTRLISYLKEEALSQ